MTPEDEEFNRIEREAAMRKEAVKATITPREWVGLTDEEMLAIVHYSQLDNARAIEAKLKEKNA
jgi:hypothetical protein